MIARCDNYCAFHAGCATVILASNSLINRVLGFIERDFPAIGDEENQRLLQEARALFEAAVPYRGFASRPEWFDAVADRFNLRRSRVKSLFYNPAVRIHAQEMDLIRAVAANT